ncbi:MAG: hypothetical protein J6J61_05060, partial [Muribaculaceae bacterium]|nr:hypothetical protein [Muribaculaceae bacterium]
AASRYDTKLGTRLRRFLRRFLNFRQVAEQKCAKLPNEIAPNGGTKSRQMAERNRAKWRNGKSTTLIIINLHFVQNRRVMP